MLIKTASMAERLFSNAGIILTHYPNVLGVSSAITSAFACITTTKLQEFMNFLRCRTFAKKKTFFSFTTSSKKAASYQRLFIESQERNCFSKNAPHASVKSATNFMSRYHDERLKIDYSTFLGSERNFTSR